MTFDYVLEILEAKLMVHPTGQRLHNGPAKDCTFYPFAHEGKILTMDPNSWRAAQMNRPAAYDLEQLTVSFPAENVISEAITREVEMGTCILFAFSESAMGETIEPDVSMPLSKVPVSVQEKFEANFIDSGFDVMDCIFGISALCDIGYTPRVAAVLRNRQMAITEHGLLQNEEDARRIAKFASAYAPEHAPFDPIKVFSRLYPQG